MTKEDIPLSKKEPDRVSVIQTTIYKRLRQHQAARQSSLSTRQIRRPVCRYRGSGALGLVSDHRGKRANNAMDPSVRPSVPTLIQERHGDFGLTPAYEKLAELHGYRLSIGPCAGGSFVQGASAPVPPATGRRTPGAPGR